jgi:putative methylase
MGRIMQKRLVRKLELEMFLSQIGPYSSPKPSLEQYTIPANVAATMLHIAAYTHDNIVDKTVLDLGCGTGRLALGAAFLSAKQVVGVDIDKDAIRLAFKNSLKMRLKGKMQWIIGDIDVAHGSFDTVLQNPPFGVQKRKADRKFLEKALESGKVVYSLHKHPEEDRILIERLKASKANVSQVTPSPFLKEFIERQGGKIRVVYAMVMTIPHMFSFHSKKKHQFIVDLFVIDKR